MNENKTLLNPETKPINDDTNGQTGIKNDINNEDYYYYYDEEEYDEYIDENEENSENTIEIVKESNDKSNDTNFSQDGNENLNVPNHDIASPDKSPKIQTEKDPFPKSITEPQFNLSSKKEVSSSSSIKVPNSINDSNLINRIKIENLEDQYYRSYSLPDYKPKNIGKGFSSSDGEIEENDYDSTPPSKSDKDRLIPQVAVDNTTNKNSDNNNDDDDNYYSDDFDEENSNSPEVHKNKSSSKPKTNSNSPTKISIISTDEQKNENNDSKSKEKTKKRTGRRKSYGCHRHYKQFRKKHRRKNQIKMSNGDSSGVDSASSFSSSFYSNDSANDDERDENKSDQNTDSSLIYQIDDENKSENEEENEKLSPQIQKLINDYESKNNEIMKDNEALQAKVKQLESENDQYQQIINDLKEENNTLKKKIHEIQEQKNSTELKPYGIHSSFVAIDRFKDIKTKKICLLGRGSSSKVIEVEDIKTGKHYAKKILFKEFLNFQGIKHFIAEFELLQYLNHPCTATVYGIEMGADDQHPCSIYFEVLQVSLMSAIDTSDSLAQSLLCSSSSDTPIAISAPKNKDPSRFLSYSHKLFTNTLRARSLVEICCGMEYVHDCGIIHRDLKAENILFNETLNAKICDFGIAQLQNAENLTKNVGSLFYMSPEMLSEKAYDKSTDVYSFGILAFYVLTGELPKIPLTKKVLGCLPEVPPYVTDLGKEIILSCCAFHPKDRPSFSDLLELMESNNFQLMSNINNDFVRKRYEELKAFKLSHPAQAIK